MAGTAAFLGYAVAQIQDSIWKGQSWGVTFKHVSDGLIYGSDGDSIPPPFRMLACNVKAEA